MNCVITTTTLRAEPRIHQTPSEPDILSYAITNCELGRILVARSTKGVCSILIGDEADALIADLARRFPKSMLNADENDVKDDIGKVLRYVAKPSEGLHLELDMRGTPFQRQVWEKLQKIPVGQTVSYTELASSLSPLFHSRSVATACAANPIALAVPCHRVVRSDGTLAGYRWGLERKRNLIEKEAAA
ncbi:AraC family transcriptional regulator of adaptative response/methylated-DNA-[protein]-cysteine methyltransferase [Ochrobactrum sp. 19YEA23]|uniref:methylated-DNA--[protein]-cysteine S-methyltransferase n=1 Tax=Ochrobactrum sp. 19YEA23 TaxID=3039854 RepID=UPI002479A23F|nr:AraC family transcriptional regulator of adaptative response/methylated-DNA-[protein]-cysteine methyltransferase [Ochrobactrum sp. 19YEA23]